MDIIDFVNLENEENEKIFEGKINIHDITHDDMKNGTGMRVVLWVAGCTHHCKECHNPITWDPNGGIPFTAWEQAEFWDWLSKPWTEGVTFSGGDPLHPRNREYIADLARQVKEKYPEKNIWLYTGYSLKIEDENFFFADELGNTFTYEPLKYIDVIVDGKFECGVRKVDIETGRNVHWRGSSNQRIIDVTSSLERKTIVLKEE